MRIPELRPRLPFAGLAVAAVVGIVLADRWALPPQWLLSAIGVLGAWLLVRPQTVLCWMMTGVAFTTLHTLRFHGGAARALASEFAAAPRVVRAAGIVWSEPEEPVAGSFPIVRRFRLKLESLEPPAAHAVAGVLMNVEWPGLPPGYGDRVIFAGSASNLEPVRNPGQFDFTRYQQRRGVYSVVRARFAEDCRIESHGHGNIAQAFALRARDWMQRQLRLDLAGSPEIATLIESMVLGMRGETPDEVRALFQRTGTLHLFAVSGLNIAMLAAMGIFLLKPLGIRRRPAVFIVIPVLAAYALVTGLSASCVRAAIMGAVLLAAQLFDRRALAANSLAAAAFAILAWDTNQLFVPGFQFSFVLVLVIMLAAAPIQRRCEKLARPDPFLPRALWSLPIRGGTWCWRLFSAAMGVTISAWLGSLAFTAGYFHLFSLSSIAANLLAVPLAFVVLALGLGAVLCGGVWSHGAMLCNNANWLAAKALLGVVRIFSEIPGGHVYVELPHFTARPACEFTVLDCRSGAAVHVRAPGSDWLLDCGNAGTARRVVLPYLRSRGVNRLDGLLLTHGDAQHIGGAPLMLAELSPRAFVDSPVRDLSSARRSLHAQLREGSLGKTIAWRGDRLYLSGGATLRVLHPPRGLVRSSSDDKALVVRLESGGMRALFMSDSGFSTEQWLLENEPDLRSDVLVKGWHAKDLSGTADFLTRVRPQAVVCSAPEFGDTGAALDRWSREVSARGITVFRQDQCGAVHVEMRDGRLELHAVARPQKVFFKAGLLSE